MNVQFTARHFKPSDDIRAHAISCVEKLERIEADILHAEVILTEEQKSSRLVCEAEFIIKVYDTVLITKAEDAKHIEAITLAARKLDTLLEQHKETLQHDRLRKSKQSSTRS
jgi:ribosomal subunit interface protein